MANLLLDHPWSVLDVLSPRSEGYECLEIFDSLIKAREGLVPVPFIAADEYFSLCQLINNDVEMAAAATYFKILAEPYVRWEEDGGDGTASPYPEPNGVLLPRSWRLALRAAINDLPDWRNPQILVCDKNVARWPNASEITIRRENQNDINRVLAIVERYGEHPFAVPDFDPWDLRKYDPVPLGNRHPCRLPKPPGIDTRSIDHLFESLQAVRQLGWRRSGRYYYVPPENWDLHAVDKARWRNGRAFPQQQGPGFKGPRVIDYDNRIWVWDHTETQWDVQQGNSYYRIGELGNLLPRSPLA